MWLRLHSSSVAKAGAETASLLLLRRGSDLTRPYGGLSRGRTYAAETAPAAQSRWLLWKGAPTVRVN